MEDNAPQPIIPPQPSTPPESISTLKPTTETKTKEEPAVEIPEENWRVSPLFYEVASFLGIDEKNYETAAPKMSLIVDWAITQAKSNKVHDLLPIISQLERTLMPPTWGERRYEVLYRYLRLAIKRDAFEKALNSFKMKGGK